MNRMTRLLLLFLAAFAAVAQFFPPVTVNTNGVLVYPTNFFTANSNAINSALGEFSAQGKLNATNGIASGLIVTNGFNVIHGDSIQQRVSGTSIDRRNAGAASRVAVWDALNALTNSPTVDLTELGYLDGVTSPIQTQIDAISGGSLSSKLDITNGTAVNLTLSGATVIEDGQFTQLIPSTIGWEEKLASFHPSTSELTNSGASLSAVYNVHRVVPTATSLVGIDPATLVATPGGSEAIVTTTGDSSAGTGWKTWRWNAGSSAATNTAVNNGPLAWPYGASSGRWILLPSAKDIVQDGVASASGYITPEAYGAIGDGATDDTAAIQAAMVAAAAADNQTCLFRNIYRVAQTGVTNPPNVTMFFVGDARLEPVAHPTTAFEATDKTGRLIELGNNNRVIGSGGIHFSGRRYDTNYTIPGGTYRAYACFRARGVTNCTIENFGFTDFLDSPIYTRDASQIEVRRCRFIKGIQAVRMFNTPKVVFSENLVTGMEMTYANVASTVTLFQSCHGLKASCNIIEDVLITAGGSTMTCFNVFNCNGAVIEGNWIAGLRIGSTINNMMGVILDGAEGGIVERNTFYSLNSGGSMIASEGSRYFTISANTFIPPGPDMYTGFEPNYMLYTRSAEIMSVTKPGGTQWNTPGIQERSLSATHNGVIAGNFVQRGAIGLFMNGSGILVENNWFIGQQNNGIRMEAHINGPTTSDDFSEINMTPRHREVVIRGNTIKNCAGTALNISDGKNVVVEGNLIANNDQADTGNHALLISPQAIGTVDTGSTTTRIEVTGSLSANTLGGRHIWLPDTRQIAEIEDNTADAIILRGAGVTTPPSSSQNYAIVRGHLDTLIFRNNRIYDDQTSHARTNVASLDPTQTYVSTNLFRISTSDGELFETGRRIVLKGVLTGPADATVEVISKDENYVDSYWVKPISPTTGTFTTSVGAAIRNGIGTVSHTASLPVEEFINQTTITGSGTSFNSWGQVLNNAYINVNSQWLRVQQVVSATSLRTLTQPATNFSGQAFTISLINIEGIQTQGRAYSVDYSPVRVSMYDNVIFGNEGSSGIANPQGLVNFSTAPNFIPRIAGNSTAPAINLAFKMMRFDYSAPTTITDLGNAFHGAEIILYPDPESDVTLGFASGGTKLRGNGGVNETLDPGEIAICRYIHDLTQSGLWYITIVK